MSPEAKIQPSPESLMHDRLNALIAWGGLEEKFHPAAFAAAEHYVDNNLYHNVEHMFEVATRAMELFDEHGESFGLTHNDRQELLMAALWHDAGFHLPLDDSFETKEDRSVRLAYDAITQNPEHNQEWDTVVFAGSVGVLILSTKPGRKVAYGTNAYLLNLADLNNLSRPVEETLSKSGKLFIEWLILQGKQTTDSAQQALSEHTRDIRDWCCNIRPFLRKLIQEKQLPEDVLSRVDKIKTNDVRRSLKTLAKDEQNQGKTK